MTEDEFQRVLVRLYADKEPSDIASRMTHNSIFGLRGDVHRAAWCNSTQPALFNWERTFMSLAVAMSKR